jgi:hypothetical protein
MSSLSRFVLCALAACGSDTPPTGSTPDAAQNTVEVDAPTSAPTICDQAKQHSDFAFLQEHVFTPSCAKSMCHTGPEPEVDLDLSAGHAYVNLVNKGTSTQSGWMRVVPGNAAQSYLVVSLGRGSGPMPRDGFMPLGAEPLCSEKLDAIERWIAAGAMP